jgi:DNA-directed RNA polymerase III subunit RPC4
MPPKAARGAVAAGRGRGRGRGKATAGESSESAILPGQTADDHASGSSVLGAASDEPKPRTMTPQHPTKEDMEPSQYSSAPAPARAPVPRTDASNPNAPHTGSLVPAGRGRGGARGGAAKPAAPSRFKPKNVRRDASELEEIARKEHDRLAAIAAENAREASAKMRGRGRPVRGRGDAMGRGGTMRKTTATGTFGIAPESLSEQHQTN